MRGKRWVEGWKGRKQGGSREEQRGKVCEVVKEEELGPTDRVA